MNVNKSKEELEKWRKEFWETRTQGNPEIWLIIRRAIESSPEDAAAFLKAGDITTYTGSLILCLDKHKFPYRVPVAIINDPVKYWPSELEKLAQEEKPEEEEFKGIKIRTVGHDDKVYDLKSHMLVEEVLNKYMEDRDLTDYKGLLIYDGRVMKSQLPLYCFRLGDEVVIQAMIIKTDS